MHLPRWKGSVRLREPINHLRCLVSYRKRLLPSVRARPSVGWCVCVHGSIHRAPKNAASWSWSDTLENNIRSSMKRKTIEIIEIMIICIYIYVYYWKCNFPMNFHGVVVLVFVGWFVDLVVDWLAGWLVFRNFLKERGVTLPCSHPLVSIYPLTFFYNYFIGFTSMK